LPRRPPRTPSRRPRPRERDRGLSGGRPRLGAMSPTAPAADPAAAPPVPVLHALTVPLSALGADPAAAPDLRELLAGPELLTWTVDGRGLVAWGRAAEHTVRG